MIKNKRKLTGALAAALPALLLTACVNHMENGEYISTGQIMAGAFSNLVIGMGTVFAVLIFLTWVISLFKHIGKIEALFTGKKAPAPEPERRRRKRKEAAAKPASDAGQKTVADAEAPGAVVSSITPAPAGEELQAVIAAAIAAYESDMAANATVPQAAPRKPALQNGIRIQKYRRA